MPRKSHSDLGPHVPESKRIYPGQWKKAGFRNRMSFYRARVIGKDGDCIETIITEFVEWTTMEKINEWRDRRKKK